MSRNAGCHHMHKPRGRPERSPSSGRQQARRRTGRPAPGYEPSARAREDPSAGRDREPVCEPHDSTGEPGALCCDLSYVAKLSQPLGKPHGSEQLHNINESGMVVSLFTMRAHRWDTSPSRRPIATPSVDLEMKAKALQTCAVSGSDPLPEHTPNWHANSELPVSRGPVVLRIMWRTSPPSPAPMGDFVEFAT